MTEKILRTCATCACYIERVLSPLAPAQGQCRRNIAVPAQIQIEKPRVLDNKPVIGKDGKPVTNKEVINTFLYAPTLPESVCFDGWRPKDTLPGEQWETKARIEMCCGLIRAAIKEDVINKGFGKAMLEALTVETTLTEPDHDN